tara:strand:- start:2816 stop:3340 length:525 start_codon:yes stop_codon:yes gene_type:complete
MKSVINTIARLLNSNIAKNYDHSASMFNAKIETHTKQSRYFLESSMFESSTGECLPRDYALKVIGDLHISKVLEFGNDKQNAFDFFENAEFLKSGALILDRSLTNYDSFLSYLKIRWVNDRAYDNGLTACYSNSLFKLIISYCEGDLCVIHCATDTIFHNELKAHTDYYKQSEC